MKKHKLVMLGMAALAVVVLAGCNNKTISSEDSVEDQMKAAEAMQAGTPMHCTMSGPDGSMETWVSGEKSKVYGTNVAMGSAGTGYMINDGEWVYMWQEGATEGTKIEVVDDEEEVVEEEEVEEMPEAEVQDFDVQEMMDEFKNYEYECKEERIPDSTFVPPSDVTFTDMMEQMEQMMQGFEMPEGMELPEGMEQ